MRRIIVGTAGHIDHGKTKLVEALTGIDCDRWEEEKTRGITIDLGFAYLRHNDLQIGFVDVPGHERFLHNALAGLGGIRLVLLVVAADEGVKPQTREHLAICSLLEIPAALVALTKTDLVATDLVELAQLEIEDLLSATPYAGAPILPVSSQTGQGVEELRRELLELADCHETPVDPDRPARLPIDRAFHLKGLGVVVTGSLVSSKVRVGDVLDLLPTNRDVRIRSVQVHGEAREEATTGERTSLQLTGVSLDELGRGMTLATPESLEASRSLCARFTLLEDHPGPVRGSIPIRLHLYASEVLGTLRLLEREELQPGETGLVVLRLTKPVVAVRGDHYIVRRPSPAMTQGGGVILDPRWRRLPGRKLPAALEALAADDSSALIHWIGDSNEVGATEEELARRLGRRPDWVRNRLRELAAEQRVLEVPAGKGHPTHWITPAVCRGVMEQAQRVLKDYFKTHRLARGMPKAEAVRRILPGRARPLADVYLSWLEAQKVLTSAGDLVNLAGRSAELTGEESQLVKEVLTAFEKGGLTPDAPAAIQARIGAKPQIFDGIIRYLLDRGSLVRLSEGLIVSVGALEKLRRDLQTTDWERFSVGQFKDRFGLTRKWAIPLLEHLDSTGVTRRVGDERMLARSPQ